MRWESTGVVRINSRVLWGRCERLCVCVCWVRRLLGASEHGWTDFPRRPEARAAAARARWKPAGVRGGRKPPAYRSMATNLIIQIAVETSNAWQLL